MTAAKLCVICHERPAGAKKGRTVGSWCIGCRKAYRKGYRARRRGLVALALVAALALVGCGGDDDSDGDGGNATEAQCKAWQDDFDDASLGFDLADPGTPAAEDFTQRMDDADTKLREGGCYG